MVIIIGSCRHSICPHCLFISEDVVWLYLSPELTFIRHFSRHISLITICFRCHQTQYRRRSAEARQALTCFVYAMPAFAATPLHMFFVWRACFSRYISLLERVNAGTCLFHIIAEPPSPGDDAHIPATVIVTPRPSPLILEPPRHTPPCPAFIKRHC